MACWSDLENDILEYITSFLPLPDHHRFSAVCKNWRRVVKEKRHSPAPQLPWLVLGEDNETKKRKFYSLSEDKHYSIDIPELNGRYICGSSYGWLFAIDIKITCILINPFTRECYELPPLPPYSRDINVTTLVERLPDDCDIGQIGKFTFEEMQRVIIYKAVLSHDPRERSDFIVMILFGEVYRPAFWRPGDSSWTLIDAPRSPTMQDVIFSKGKCYVVAAGNKLFAMDFGPVPKLTELRPWRGITGSIQVYLADFNGFLLLIERFHYYLGEKSITCQFDVLEPEFEEEVIHEWSDIDGYALFLGTNSSIIIDSNHFSTCKQNSIYFTHTTENYSAEEFGCHDLGIFDMMDNTVSEYYPYESFHHPIVGAPIWFIPNP